MKQTMKWLLVLVPFLAIGYLATLTDEPPDESERFVDNKQYLAKNEMLADLDTLLAVFERIHPNPYRFVSKSQQTAYLDSIEMHLADSLPIIGFWRLIDQYICSYTDAHSYADDTYVLTDYIHKGKLFFPLSAKIENGQILVSANTYGEQILPEGAKILSINNKPAQEIIRQLLAHSPKETHALDSLEVSDDFGLYLWKTYNWEADFTIYYTNTHTENIDSLTTAGITWGKRKEMAAKSDADPLVFNFLKNNVGYMKIANFDSSEGEINDFYRKSFRQLKERQSGHLILDIRGHSGGRDSYGEDLAKYIATEPFRKLSKAYWKITPAFKNAFNRAFIPKGIRWFKPVYLLNEYSKIFYGAEPNQMVEIEYELKDPLPEEDRFLGEVFLLTDHRTFSAGSIFAEMFKHFNMGKVVGQPTGNLCSFNGFALANFTLPHSKLTYQVSSVYNLANNGEEGLTSVTPNFYIDFSTDPIDYTLDRLIKNQPKPTAL